jgi:DNA invertase Pin-like site-specific DNA recombinase
MTKTQVEVITSVQRRRRWSRAEKERIRRSDGLVVEVDRLGRSLQDLVGFLSELHALKIDLFLRQQGLDTTTPAGKTKRCFR